MARFRIITHTVLTDGPDRMTSWPGHDTIEGLGGDDVLSGMDGGDTLLGGAGNDRLIGGDGYDTLDGGDGDDFLIGGPGGDTMDGGAGIDTVSFAGEASGVTVVLTPGVPTGDGYDLIRNVENIVGTSFDDVLQGDAGVNRLTGGEGDDLLNGGAGRDTVVFYGAQVGVSVDLAAGTASGEGDDRLIGIESVMGSRHGDTLRGDGAANWLTGREGDDLLDGRGGVDVASFAYAQQGVTVHLEDLPGSGIGSASGEGTDGLVDIEGAVGSAHDDELWGSAGANWLSAGAGNDRLDGGAGDDDLTGGAGHDLFTFAPGSGHDILRDFDPNRDLIDLSGYEGPDFAELSAQMTAQGSATLITLSATDSILIQGIAPSALAAEHFLLG